jgi:hypothetical protein
MHTDHIWKLVARVVLILVFGGIGLGRIFWPDHFVQGSSGLNGSRASVRCFGAVFIVLVAFMLYGFLADTFLASSHGV